MVATVVIEAGVCGFRTTARAVCADEQHVAYQIGTDCANIQALAEALAAGGPVDAYAEIGPDGPGRLMATVRAELHGCCQGCAVPVGLFKAMQVAAGLALPRDVAITLAKDTE